MFSLVLLALMDENDGRPAARLASALAARHGAGFTVLHVSGPMGPEGGCVLQLPGEAAQSARRAGVEAMLREIMPPGQTADVMQAAGFAHVEVLKAARILGPDLLVLGGATATDRCLGELTDADASAALLLAVSAPCPVLVMPNAGSAPAGPFEHLLTCVDLAHDEERLRPQLTLAARLAAREGAALTVLHVLALAPGQAAPDHTEMTRNVDAAKIRMCYLCKGLPGADRFTLAACEGDPCQEPLAQARRRMADLLLLPCGDADQDAKAERILSGARCPVLLLGPAAATAFNP